MKKNIMLLIGYLKNGGAEHSIIKLANELSKYHNVILVVASKKGQDYDCLVPIVEIKELRNKKTKLKGTRKLKKLKKEYRIDTTISYISEYNFYNVISKYKDKTIISIRNHLSTKKERKIERMMHRISIRLCDRIVCCSNSVMLDQIKNFHANSKKTCVIPNFCNLKEIEAKVNEKIDIEDKKYITDDMIVSIARLVPQKGHEHIIRAMNLVVKENKNAKLLLFSRGPLKEKLEELVKSLHLENNIYFMGFHPNPYLFLKQSKCFILASKYEGMPNVILEAMACNTPVIATDAPGGSKELLMDKCDYNTRCNSITEVDYGVLIPPFSSNESIREKQEEDLANEILKFLNDNKFYKYYQLKSKERIKNYSSTRIIKKWLKIIG